MKPHGRGPKQLEEQGLPGERDGDTNREEAVGAGGVGVVITSSFGVGEVPTAFFSRAS